MGGAEVHLGQMVPASREHEVPPTPTLGAFHSNPGKQRLSTYILYSRTQYSVVTQAMQAKDQQLLLSTGTQPRAEGWIIERDYTVGLVGLFKVGEADTPACLAFLFKTFLTD